MCAIMWCNSQGATSACDPHMDNDNPSLAMLYLTIHRKVKLVIEIENESFVCSIFVQGWVDTVDGGVAPISTEGFGALCYNPTRITSNINLIFIS